MYVIFKSCNWNIANRLRRYAIFSFIYFSTTKRVSTKFECNPLSTNHHKIDLRIWKWHIISPKFGNIHDYFLSSILVDFGHLDQIGFQNNSKYSFLVS